MYMSKLLGFTLMCLVWGSTWLVIKIGLESIPPFLGAAVRFLIASLIMYSIVVIRGVKIPKDPISVRLYILVGICSFSIGYSLVYWGQQYIPSALAAILFGTFPFFVAGMSWFVYKSEDITLSKVLGIVIGFIGVIFIFSEDVVNQFGEASFFGMLVIILAASIQAVVSVTIKKYGNGISTFALNTIGMSIGTSILFIISIIIEDWGQTVIDRKAIGSVLYLATFGTVVTFGLLFWLLKHIEAVKLSLLAFITPIIAVLLGTVFAEEEFTIQIYGGSALVLIGILISNIQELIATVKR